MGLKPLSFLHKQNPFTEVNGNIQKMLVFVLLPSASADGKDWH